MDKTIAICKLQEIADHHLLGPGGWPACGESVPAFFRTIRDLGLDEAVQGGFTRSTTLGNELSVELMTVFAGCWDSVNVPNILAEHGYIEWSEAEELWELPEFRIRTEASASRGSSIPRVSRPFQVAKLISPQRPIPPEQLPWPTGQGRLRRNLHGDAKTAESTTKKPVAQTLAPLETFPLWKAIMSQTMSKTADAHASAKNDAEKRAGIEARRLLRERHEETGTPIPDESLKPNITDIKSHLDALFNPAFVHAYPDAWIEIAYGKPSINNGAIQEAQNYKVFDLKDAAEFAEAKNAIGWNLYVGPALRHGKQPGDGRADDDSVLTSGYAWAEFDGAGDDERIEAILKANNLKPAMVITTGMVPYARRHLYFKIEGDVISDQLKVANTALCKLLGSDTVQNASRLMRLAGTINYPSPKKRERGYVDEVTTLRKIPNAPAYTIDNLIALDPDQDGASNDPYAEAGKNASGTGRTDDEIIALLETTREPGKWHDNMRDAIASMIGYGWPDSAIKVACSPYCGDGKDDADLPPMIDKARIGWNKPNIEGPPSDGNDTSKSLQPDVIERMNKKHAVLPIGGKTRVVKFGELPEFPGRETIVMTQTLDDFAKLHSKYRHTFRNKKGELESVPLGSYWLGSTERRQYDGGMAFMPNRDGDVGDQLNLFRGFGVKAKKPEGKTGAEGCDKFLEFVLNIICSGNRDHFEYLIKREATIFQKQIRTEIALGLQTKEEGAGKGFYEKTMARVTGSHAMQVTNPQHIIGKFNPHLETLLRLTADEALFVNNHDHRNSLFGLVAESKLTIEPKGHGVYQADNFLNISVLSNNPHFLPVGPNARQFFIPTVSAARLQDFTYFGAIQDQLDNGGYEALLYFFMHEVDLTGFNVRDVPKTAGLRAQRNLSLEPLEVWWVELLETATLTGSDPDLPNRAVSNSYQKEVKIEVDGSYGTTTTQVRYVTQRGLFDQAKLVEPRLKNYNDYKLGRHLADMGCTNKKKVLRKQGWNFPPLVDCRKAWEAKYQDWKWRNPDLTAWQPEDDDADDVARNDPRPGLSLVVDNDDIYSEAARLGARPPARSSSRLFGFSRPNVQLRSASNSNSSMMPIMFYCGDLFVYLNRPQRESGRTTDHRLTRLSLSISIFK